MAIARLSKKTTFAQALTNEKCGRMLEFLAVSSGNAR
jgi:hypothetical protein